MLFAFPRMVGIHNHWMKKCEKLNMYSIEYFMLGTKKYQINSMTILLDMMDENKLFKEFPWEDRMKLAHEQGTLVLLQNLDPSLTSQEVEDLVRHAFQENCTGKIIHAAAYSSPHSGQAFVIFGRREAAEQAVRKLNQSCLLMSNGRPLVGSFGNPCFPEKKPKFHGHIVIDQLRMQMRREMKDAVSTSHCSQSNNVEYDMAVDWCLLQERTDYAWEKLFQQQGEELKNVKAKLKAK